MDSLEYNYDGRKLVIDRVSGAGSTSMFFIMLDNYFHGQIWNTELYGWRYSLNEDSPLTMDDIDVILADIKKATDEGG